jgi:hypothetical protein
MLPPDKHEIEIEVSGMFRNGDIKNVARYVQRDSGLVSKLLSANCEDKNNVVYFFLLFLWAFDSVRRELGDTAINIVLREREKWLVRDVKHRDAPSKLTGAVGKEYVEAIESELSGKSYDEQIKQWMDVEYAARAKKRDIIDARNEARFGTPNMNFNNGRHK